MILITSRKIPESNIFKRIWKAIKYLFGHRSIYGDFDEFIFKPKDADKLQEVVDYLKALNSIDFTELIKDDEIKLDSYHGAKDTIMFQSQFGC